MPVAFKKDELKDIANEDKLKKIKAEYPFEKDLTRFFKNINREFENYYISNGVVIDAREWSIELTAILLLNYQKVSNIFKFNIRESFNEKVSKDIDALINTKITDFQDTIAKTKTNYILNTTNLEIRREIENTVSSLIKEGKEVERIEVANITRKELNKKVTGRANTISITETSGMAESSKFIEKETLIYKDVRLDNIRLKNRLKDVWVANLDERTRPAHISANGQIKNYNEKFFVGGEFLKYPADPNASMANTINCRCSLVSRVY